MSCEPGITHPAWVQINAKEYRTINFFSLFALILLLMLNCFFPLHSTKNIFHPLMCTTPTLFIEHFQHRHSRHEGLYANTTKDVQSTHSLGLVSVLQCCIFLLAYETLADTEGLLNPASSWPRGKTFIKD